MAEPVAVLRYEVSGILDKAKVNVKPATDGAHMLQIVSNKKTKVTFYYDDENEKRQPSIDYQTGKQTGKERKVESIEVKYQRLSLSSLQAMHLKSYVSSRLGTLICN